MEKKRLNGKLLTIIILIVIVLLLGAAAIYLTLKDDKKLDNNTSVGGEEVKEKTPEEKAKDLLYNIFLISYILEGDVQIGEGSLSIDDGETYNAVTDVLLADFHTITDITDLIDNNLTEESAARAKKIMESDYANQYTYNNDVLYVKKNIEPCEVVIGGPIEKDKAEYRLVEDNTYIVYKNVPYQGYYDENNNLKAGALWFTCAKNFGSIGTGKDDKYIHDYSNDDKNNKNEDE